MKKPTKSKLKPPRPNRKKFLLLVRQGTARRKALRLAGYRPSSPRAAASLAYKLISTDLARLEALYETGDLPGIPASKTPQRRPISQPGAENSEKQAISERMATAPEFEVAPKPDPPALIKALLPPTKYDPPVDPLTAILDKHGVGSEPGVKIDREKFAQDLQTVHSPEVFEVIQNYKALAALHPGLADDLEHWHRRHVTHKPDQHTELGRRAILKELFIALEVTADKRQKIVNWLTYLWDWSDLHSVMVCPPVVDMNVENTSEENEQLYHAIRRAFRDVNNLPLFSPASLPVPVKMAIEQEVKEESEAADVWSTLDECDAWGMVGQDRYPLELMERAMALPDDFKHIKRRALTDRSGKPISPDYVDKARESAASERERREKILERARAAIESQNYISIGGRIVPESSLPTGDLRRIGKGVKEVRAKKAALQAEAERLADDMGFIAEKLTRDELEATKNFVEVMQIRRPDESEQTAVNPGPVSERTNPRTADGDEGISDVEGAAEEVEEQPTAYADGSDD